MNRQHLTTGSDFEAKAGYSRAIVQGDWCFVSGTTGYNYPTLEMPESIEDQTENCMKTIKDVLQQASFSLNDVIRVRYYLTDASNAELVFPIVGRWFANVRPAATMVICGLIRPEMKIEIEVDALRSS